MIHIFTAWIYEIINLLHQYSAHTFFLKQFSINFNIMFYTSHSSDSVQSKAFLFLVKKVVPWMFLLSYVFHCFPRLAFSSYTGKSCLKVVRICGNSPSHYPNDTSHLNLTWEFSSSQVFTVSILVLVKPRAARLLAYTINEKLCETPHSLHLSHLSHLKAIDI